MPFTFECERCGAEFQRNYRTSATRTGPRYCSTGCHQAVQRVARKEKSSRRRDLRCASCGCAGATPRERTEPRDYSVIRSVLCGKCAARDGWGAVPPGIANPVATWL